MCYGILLSSKKRWNTAICHMDRPQNCYAKQNKSEKAENHMSFHWYVGCKTETHRHREQYGAYQREGGGR